RDELERQAPLDPRRRAPAPPDRRAHRPARGVAVGAGHGLRRIVLRRRRRRQARLPPRARRAGGARRARDPGAVRRVRRRRGRESLLARSRRGAGVHLTSSPVDWYAARSAGIVAYVLLSVVVALGLVLSGRRRLPRWPRF